MFSVAVENAGYLQDSANLSINIEVLNRKTGTILVTSMNVSLNWTLTVEVRQSWPFEVAPRKFTDQGVVLSVTVIGLKDDEGLYQHLEKDGIIILHGLLMLTR